MMRERALPIQSERFEVLRVLGAGGMGVVYEALDHATGATVALKTLQRLDGQALYRFKNEFRQVVDLSHPNLARLFELHSDGSEWFFTMEYVPVRNIVDAVREIGDDDQTLEDVLSRTGDAGGRTGELGSSTGPAVAPPLDDAALARMREVMLQLAYGLDALHRLGRVHCDVKPSNVLVTPDGVVKVLDFGLLQSVDPSHREARTEQAVAGTVAYMAPEQGLGSQVGPPADWYAFGVILFQMLVGAPPFVGEPVPVLFRKMREPAPRVRELSPWAPADLDALVASLLATEPGARPGFAEVAEVLAGEAPATRPSSGDSTEIAPPFVGRARELDTLSGALADVATGATVTVLVHGAPGIGKSSLVRHFLDAVRARDPQTLVLVGRCREQESVRFNAFDGVIDGLTHHLRQRPAREVAALVGPDTHLAGLLFPVLTRVDALAPRAGRTQPKDPTERRARAFAAIRALLANLASERPVIVLVDDLQWADADSLQLLAEVMGHEERPRLLFVATSRRAPREERSSASRSRSSPLLEAALEAVGGEFRSLEIGELSPSESRVLFGEIAGESASFALSEAQGHPLFLCELARHMRTGGDASMVASDLEGFLRERVRRLPDEPRTLLELLALSGRPLRVSVLAGASGFTREQVRVLVRELRVQWLVRLEAFELDSPIETFHDRIREVVGANLPESTRVRHHARLADALAGTSGPGVAEAVVRHLVGSNQPLRAAKAAIRAVDEAHEALAFDEEARFLKLALELGEHAEEEARALRIRLGIALTNAGRLAEAAEHFLASAEGAPREIRLDCQRRAAENLMLTGNVARGTAVCEAVLSDLGVDLAATTTRALLRVGWLRARLAMRGLDSTPRDAATIPRDELLRLDAYQIVGRDLALVEPARAGEFVMRELLLALDLGEPMRVVECLAIHGLHRAVEGKRSEGKAAAIFETCRKVVARRPSERGTRWVDGLEAIADMYAGRFAKAAATFEEVERWFLEETFGESWYVGMIRAHRLPLYVQRGRFREALAYADELLRDAVRRGDRTQPVITCYGRNRIWLAKDRPDVARAQLEGLPRLALGDAFEFEDWISLAVRAETDLYERSSKDGFAAHLAELERGRKSLLLRFAVMPRCEGLYLEGRLALARLEEKPDDASAARKARRAASALAGEKTPYAVAWGHVIGAALAAREGRVDVAKAALEDCVVTADALEMRPLAAAARHRLGALLGGDDGRALAQAADAALAASDVVDPRRMVAFHAPGFSRG